ncbi:MAG: DUF4870 domain-containing protein [Armatimonadota bacterium]
MDSATDRSPGDALLAGLAHLSVIVQPVGMLLPLVLYLIYAQRSRFIARHAAQALGWQIFFFLLFAVISVLGVLTMIITGGVAVWQIAQHPDTGALPQGVLLVFFIFITLVTVLGIIEWITAIVAALIAFQGRPYRYPLTGGIVDRITHIRPAE